jgi:hypothetical protein
MLRICLFLLVLYVNPAFAQRKMETMRTLTPPKIDGLISDSDWGSVIPADDFINNSPDYGKPASKRTLVWILYDDEAIYVAAKMFDNPTEIRKQLTARDKEQRQDVDFFTVCFDTYNDDQNAFQFTVTSRNVQSDARISLTSQRDYSWDAVWESNVKFVEDGWELEMKIPYISLRFSQEEIQHWGINFNRFTRKNNESSFWSPVNPNIAGFVNQFGELDGIRNITPPLRLSFLPYISSGYRSTPNADVRNNEWLRNGGMDLKWGVNESFTLDATLVPDFGQVISDNNVLNLSPYEVRFQENRPFFTEGTELFNKAGLFYSRRIGLTPNGYYDVNERAANDTNISIIRNPGVTQLINAVKFSGRNKNNLGIGIFNAISAPMYATIKDKRTNSTEKLLTAPLTNYNVIVLDQALKGRSSLTFTNTNVTRSGIARDANVSALDFAFYDKKNIYALTGTARYSMINDKNGKNGYNTQLSIKKVSGKFQFEIGQNIESENYNPNDLGFLQAPNEFTSNANFAYKQLTPTKNFLTYSYSIGITNSYLYTPMRWSDMQLSASAFYFFKNFWDLTFVYESKPVWQHDFFELRTPGRMVRMMPWQYFGINGSSDSRKRFFAGLDIGYANTPAFKNSTFYRGAFNVRYRFSDRLSLEIATDGSYDKGNVGYAFQREANGDPIIGWRDVKVFSTVLSGIVNFTPRMFLTMRARHYWSNVAYKNYYNVDEKGYWVDRPFIPGNDNNYNTYNLDMFYTWDFMYGSRFILGWKNWMPQDAYIDGGRYPGYLKNLQQVFSIPQGREITARLIYFLDHRKIHRRRASSKEKP